MGKTCGASSDAEGEEGRRAIGEPMGTRASGGEREREGGRAGGRGDTEFEGGGEGGQIWKRLNWPTVGGHG